jgi:hypothetical protein
MPSVSITEISFHEANQEAFGLAAGSSVHTCE